MDNRKHLRRLPLAGAQNTRDLGGYPCAGGATRWGVFLRSDSPARLTEADLRYLAAYGVRAAVDLRSPQEGAAQPSRLASCPDFTVHNVSLNVNIEGIDYEGDLPGSMAGLYIALLDGCRPEITRVMQLLAQAEGGALFHCAVGKDRTGVIAMLLLKLAGVADDDVVADYAVTDIYFCEMLKAQAAVFAGQLPDHVLYSRPASMRRALRHLQECCGGAEAYLLACGLTPETLAAIRDKFVEGETNIAL